MAKFILSVVGSDRPGLTQALAGAIFATGGNWLESHLSQLGGLYVGSVLVDLATDDFAALATAARAIDDKGLDVRIAPAAAEQDVEGAALHFSLVGQDRPGIVNQITQVLSGLHVNIEAFDTRLSIEPHSGAQLFHIEAKLRLPPQRTADQVQTAIEQISGEIMVDVALTPLG